MNFFRKYNILSLLLLFGGLFLLLPTNQAKAEQWGCIKDSICTNLTATDILDFRSKCSDFCGTPVGPNCKPTLEVCQPQSFGCWSGKDASCKPIVSDNIDKADAECTAGCESGYECAISPVPCPPPGVYGCENSSGSECENSDLLDATTAEEWCKALCPACHLRTNACPASTASLGTSLPSLQATAFSKLNKARLDSPAELIKRFINLLMAFIGSITLVLYVFAGVLWLSAGGESDRVEKSKKIMVWTTLGVAVMLFSYMLVSFLFNIIPK